MSQQSTALHEAAHAVVAHVLGVKHSPLGLTIKPGRGSFGKYHGRFGVRHYRRKGEHVPDEHVKLALNLAGLLAQWHTPHTEDAVDLMYGAMNDIHHCAWSLLQLFGYNFIDGQATAPAWKAVRFYHEEGLRCAGLAPQENQQCWDDHVMRIIYAVRSAHRRTLIKKTPAKLLGNELSVLHQAAYKAFSILKQHNPTLSKLKRKLLRCKKMSGAELTSFLTRECN